MFRRKWETMFTVSGRTLLPVLIVAIVGLSTAFYLASPHSVNANPMANQPTLVAGQGQSAPPEVWSQAPYLGWEYFVSYSTNSGQIIAIAALSTEQITQNLKNCPNDSTGISCLFPAVAGQAVLNGTTYANIGIVASHMNAYFVNTQTQQIVLRSGWTNCSNPDYGNGTIPCS
jgi:hypothetical protein